MADFPTVDANSDGGSGGWTLYVKETNDQVAVFTSTANRDAYFAANPEELTLINASGFMIGIGTVAEDSSSVLNDGWQAYNSAKTPQWDTVINVAIGARGEKGQDGNTPTILTVAINQPGHGFTQTDVNAGKMLTNTAGSYVTASSSDLSTTASAMLAAVVDVNNFIAIISGFANRPSHGFADGIYYLSETGTVTATRPVTGIVQEVFRITDSDNLIVDIGQPTLPHTEGSEDLMTRLFNIAVENNYSSGDEFTIAQGDDFLSHLGFPATFAAGSRAKPKYYLSSNEVGFYTNNGGTDPASPTNLFCEFVIPKESLSSDKDLMVSGKAFGSQFERWILAYNGDATAGGTRLPLARGDDQNTSETTPTSRFWAIPDDCEDIHVYFGQQVITGVELINKSARVDMPIASANLPAAIQVIAEQGSYANSDQISIGDGTRALSGLGLNAYLRQTNGRVAPNVAIGAGYFGIYGGTLNADPTGDAGIVEIVIPKTSLKSNMVVKVEHSRTASLPGTRAIQVYSGDPVAGGTKLTPIYGVEENETTDSQITGWNVSTTPNNGGLVTEDLHIVCIAQFIWSIEVYNADPSALNDSHAVELRGGVRPDAFDTATTYNRLDQMFHQEKSWVCKQNGVTGPFVASEWKEASTLGAAKEDVVIEEVQVSHSDQLDHVRGGMSNFPAYSETVGYNADDIVIDPSGEYRQAKADIASPSGAFDDSLWYSYSLAAVTNAGQIRDLLQTLLLDNRLDASAIKNLPSAVNPHNRVDKTLNPSNNWIDMVVWDALAPSTQDGISADVILYGISAANGFILESNIKVFGTRGTDWTGTIDIITRLSKYPVSGTTAQYRVVRDSSSDTDVMRLQFLADVDFDIEWTMVNKLPISYDSPGVTFDLNASASNPSQEVLEILDVTAWEQAGVSKGGSDGIAARNIIDFLNRCAVDFSTGSVQIFSDNDVIAEFNNSGTRLNSGEYQTFQKVSEQAFSGISPPFPDVVMNADNTPNFTFPEITMSYVTDTAWRTEAYPRAPWTVAFRPDNASNSIRFTVGGFSANQKVSINFIVGKLTVTSGGTYELRDDNGVALGTYSLNIGDPAVPSNNLWRTEITLPAGTVASDVFVFDIVRTDTADYNVNKMFLLDYGFTVETIQPALEEGVALQIDSNTRGFLPPRIFEAASSNHPDGAQAVSILTGDPIIAKNGEWKSITTEKLDRSAIDFGAYYFAEDGVTPASDGQWKGGYSSWAPASALGFDNILRLNASNNADLSTSDAQNTSALWTSAYTNGYRFDATAYHVAGTTAITIEPVNAGGWTAGRVGINMVINGANVDITPANASGTFSMPASTMFKVSIVCEDPATSTDALIYINGVHVLTDTYGGYNGQRGVFLFQLGSSDFYLQDMGFNVLSTAAEDQTLSATDLDGLRYIVPHVANPVTLRIPKGKFVNGTTFTIVNGSTSTATLTGTANDLVLIGNETAVDILPNKEVTFTQTGFPKGNEWSTDNAKVSTQTSKGNTLFVTVSAAGAVLNRHGTYTGAIDVTKLTTGEYQVYPSEIAGHVFSSANTFMQAAIIDNIPVRHATSEFAIGYPTVSTYDTDGTTAIDEAFTLILMW